MRHNGMNACHIFEFFFCHFLFVASVRFIPDRETISPNLSDSSTSIVGCFLLIAEIIPETMLDKDRLG